MKRRGSIPGLADRLRSSREARGWSQADLAAEAQERGWRISRLEISRYETDASTPGPLALMAMAGALECSIDWLLTGGVLCAPRP